MKRIAAVCCLLAVSACGVRPSGVIAGGEAPRGQVVGSVVFYVSGDSLAPATGPFGDLDARLDRLAAGPTEDERRMGLRSEIPPGTALRSEIHPSGLVVVATVDPRTLSELALEQIVCTASLADRSQGDAVIIAGHEGSLPPKRCGN